MNGLNRGSLGSPIRNLAGLQLFSMTRSRPAAQARILLLGCLFCAAAVALIGAQGQPGQPAPDALTSATARATADASKQMPQDALRAVIVDFLRGYEKNPAGRWHYREMYQLATALDGEPLSSPVEFVLDPETMRFYAVSEKGTEKLLHIARNPAVSLSWVQRIDAGNAADFPRGYFGAVGIQIRGRARIVPPEDPGIMGMLNLYMPTLPNFPGLPAWNPADGARVRRLFAAQSVTEVVPDSILITNPAWTRDGSGYAAKQIWRPLTSEKGPASSR